MAKSTRDNTKHRAEQTGVLIGVRLQPEQLAPLDAWINSLPSPPTRPEAIRQLVKASLESKRMACD